MQQRRARALPPVLGRSFLGRVIDVSYPYMSAFFDVARVRDPVLRARIATLEYLFETSNPRLPPPPD